MRERDKNVLDTGLYKSKEELYFSWWLDELKSKGYIKKYEYECESLELAPPLQNSYTEELKTKTKEKSETLIREHIYTPDFKIFWTEKAKGVFWDSGRQNIWPFRQVGEDLTSYVEVKGGFDSGNMTRLFIVNQKWLYSKLGIFVNLVKITNKKGGFFDKTFTPKRFMTTDLTNKPRKINHNPRFLS